MAAPSAVSENVDMGLGEQINPEILVWARESAGLSIGEAAERLALTSSERGSAAQKLAQLEEGIRRPTRSQLAKFAAVYRRPLIAFYLESPPRRGVRGEDFRALADGVSQRNNALLDALLRDVRARQALLRSVLEDEDESRDLAFVNSLSLSEGVEFAADRLRADLGLSSQPNERPRGVDQFFRHLRVRTEKLGAFVLLVGDLGSHHSILGEDVFRGFVISDSIAPFIVINDQDAKSARAFTLVHELTHIYLGQSGVSGAPESVADKTPLGEVERFCNDVASEVLLPAAALAARPASLVNDDKAAASHVIQSVADTWSVSEPMVAYRLYRLKWLSRATYSSLVIGYSKRWKSIKAKERAKASETEGGPSYYVVKQHKLGDALIDAVRRTVRDNLLSHTKAAKILGVKPNSVEPLLRQYEFGGERRTPETRK